LHAETKARRVANLFAAIENHRELWTDFYRRPELWRILDASADVLNAPPTLQESGFVKLIIQHTNGVYQALQNGLVIKPEGLQRDVCSFFSLPIPLAVWDKAKVVQNDDFVAFIEACLNGNEFMRDCSPILGCHLRRLGRAGESNKSGEIAG
jgi:hypothetical protein